MYYILYQNYYFFLITIALKQIMLSLFFISLSAFIYKGNGNHFAYGKRFSDFPKTIVALRQIQTIEIIIIFTDGSVMRTCAKLKVPVDDCKTANDVTYCYCKRELCNNPSQKLDKPGSGIGSNHNPHGLQIQSIDPSKGKLFEQ